MTARQLGPENGTLRVHTYREGVVQRVGHDLVLDVEQWDATVDVAPDGAIQSVRLHVDPTSLHVREGRHGVKPITDKDRRDIRKSIDDKILERKPIAFTSSAVEPRDGGVTVRGELEMAGTTRSASFDLDVDGDGHVTGTLPVTQSEWGIKPYRAFMGALKVRDDVEIVLDVRLPAGA